MARLGRAQPNRPIVVRNTLEDPPVLTTAAPVVVTRNPDPRFRARSRAQVVRSSLDNGSRPVVVVSKRTAAASRAGRTIITRAPLADEVVIATSGPQTFVVTQARRTPVNPAPIVTQAPLIEEESAVLPGPRTFVVTPVRRDRTEAQPLIIRAPLADVPPADSGIGTQALVVTSKRRPHSFNQATIVRAPVETAVPPVPPETNPDLCAYPPIITWYAETPVITWLAGPPITGWLAGPPEDGC